MILRRLAQHLREQNWTAISIEFVLLVGGVFLGIQVSNWNDARIERLEESLLLERIRTDFVRIREDSERSLAYHQTMVDDLKIMVGALRADKLEPEHVPAFERALLLGVAFQTSADHSGTFTELLSSGRANILRDKELLRELVAYEDFLERFAVAQEYFVDMVYSVFGAYTSRFSYNVDFPFGTEALQLNLDGAGSSEYDFDAMAADPAFENAAEQLVFMHSLYTMWRKRIAARIEGIEQRLAEAKP